MDKSSFLPKWIQLQTSQKLLKHISLELIFSFKIKNNSEENMNKVFSL